MIALLPLTATWLAGAVLLLADGRRRPVAGAAALLLAGVGGLDGWLMLRQTFANAAPFVVITGDWPQGIGIRLAVDGLSYYFGAICALVLAAVMQHESSGGARSRLFPAFVVLMCAGLHGAFFTADLFNFYVFFELSVVTSFALAVYGYGRAESRGALIYMAVNLLGSVLFLIGVAGIYHATGTLDFELLARFTDRGSGEPILVVGALLLTALSLKLGLFPFHGWVPVVYGHSRPAVAAALAGALVNIGAYGLLRIGLAVFPVATDAASTLLVTLGAAATVYGSLLAVSRRAPAELAAYAAIAQAGYVVLGFGVGGGVGIAAVLLVVLSGAIDKTTMFIALDLEGRARRYASLVAAISLSALPFTVGFIAKLQLFAAGIEPPGSGLALAALLVSTPLVIAAGQRFWRLVGAAAATEAPKRLALVPYALPTVGLALGIAPEGLGELVARLGARLVAEGS